MGLISRRRYRWTRGRVSDYWDEVFTIDGIVGRDRVTLDDQSAFIASLGGSRSPRMRDVLGTIQADQDAIIRAGPRGDDSQQVRLSADDWAQAFEAVEPGTAHNAARDQIWADLVADLWSVPAYLRKCAPWLSPDEVQALQRRDARAWTVSDLPLLDAARQRLGDPEASQRQRRHNAAVAAEREQVERVVDNLIEAADDEYGVGLVSMLRGEYFHDALVDQAAQSSTDPDLLAGPFAHVVVDEAQELTDAEWQMLLLRSPSRSFTIVGDRTQARHGFTESWQERLERIGLDQISVASLSINYRTPQEVMAEAEPVIRAVLPDANVPTSIRSTNLPVRHGAASDLGSILHTWRATHADGVACVIGDSTFRATSRVRSLTPELSKGLEFDLVILIDPDAFGAGIEGAVDRYVAMTRATQRLVILTSSRRPHVTKT